MPERPELHRPSCDNDGCRAGASIVTTHGRRLCGNPAHMAAEDGERILWHAGTGSRPPAEWWLPSRSSNRLAHRVEGGHWLVFDDDRHVTGCQCGFAADPDDAGYGDSVLDHFEQVVRAEEQNGMRALDATVRALLITYGYDAVRVELEAQEQAPSAGKIT